MMIIGVTFLLSSSGYKKEIAPKIFQNFIEVKSRKLEKYSIIRRANETDC